MCPPNRSDTTHFWLAGLVSSGQHLGQVTPEMAPGSAPFPECPSARPPSPILSSLLPTCLSLCHREVTPCYSELPVTSLPCPQPGHCHGLPGLLVSHCYSFLLPIWQKHRGGVGQELWFSLRGAFAEPQKSSGIPAALPSDLFPKVVGT